MKRLLSVLTAIILILSLSACTENTAQDPKNDIVLTGKTVYAMDVGDDIYLEFDCDDGFDYAIVANRENTGLVWLDQTAFEYWEGTDIDAWDMLNFGMSLEVTVIEQIDSLDEELGACVDAWYMADKIVVTEVDESNFAVDAKPVIYLYPKEHTNISVKLDYSGELTCTYPKYENGWEVTAESDGRLYDNDGKEYSYLYWEGISTAQYDFSSGVCVAGKDTAAYLEYALEAQGLTRREANEFIVYWLPVMEKNAYNLISFQTDVYTENAKLEITPEPDTTISVFMAWKALENPQSIPPQSFETPSRCGFTAVEWGGCEVK